MTRPDEHTPDPEHEPDKDAPGGAAGQTVEVDEATDLWNRWGGALAEVAEPLLRQLDHIAQETGIDRAAPLARDLVAPLISRVTSILGGRDEDEDHKLGGCYELVGMHSLIDQLLETESPKENVGALAMHCQIQIVGGGGQWLTGVLARSEIDENLVKMMITGKDGKGNPSMVELFTPVSAITGIMVPRAIEVKGPTIYTGGGAGDGQGG